jgi:predicted dehydrogenase
VAVVGCGAWGRNLVRVFHGLPGSNLLAVCDKDEERLAVMRRQFPGLHTTADLDSVLAEPALEAVVVGASAKAHHPLAMAALRAGKHVYVEKPLALSVEDSEEMVRTASDADRLLMVGHLLLYHPAVLYLRRLIDDGELGGVHYLYSQRVNLGVVRQDENALWSFGPHDISIMNFLVGDTPESVAARGCAYLQPGIEDVVFVNLRYPGGRMGQIQLSWLDPHKVRKLTLVGSRKMAVFDDMEAAEKIRIYDKGAKTSPEYASFGEYLGLRHGDVVIPRLDLSEPLKAEANHFLDCIRSGRPPRTEGREGLEVVRVLEAASRSLARDGEPVTIRPAGEAGP